MAKWRSWAFHRSRNMDFLWKVCVGIVGGAILLAAGMQALRSHDSEEQDISVLLVSLEDPGFSAANQYRRLVASGQPQPGELADWIRGLTETTKKKMAPWTFDAAGMRMGTMEIQPLLEKHLPDGEQRELFKQFTRGWLLAPGAERDEAVRQVHESAQKTPRLRFANEFAGDFLVRDDKRAEGLAAYLREADFEDASRARYTAFTTALSLKDQPALRRLCADPRCAREIDPALLYVAAKTLGDRGLMLRFFVKFKLKRWLQGPHVPLALFSGVVWYIILVRSAGRERLRRWRYLSPVFAGVVSVWLLQWAQSAFHYSMPEDREGDPMREFLQYVIHVGVPEEAVKLLMFALFVPLLVRSGSESKAALTAGCVGLGFAMCENVGYYNNYGAGAAVGRLVMANFMHIAMTGIIGVWFYEMIRSRFHRAGEFVTAFLGVAAAHGGYDFAATMWATAFGINFVGIVILAVLARTYLHHLHPHPIPGPKPAVSNTAIFMVGLASVVAFAILISVWQMDTMKGVTELLKSTLAIIPVSVFYVREFREI